MGLTVCGVVVTVVNLNGLLATVSLSFDAARLVFKRWFTCVRSRPALFAVILNLIFEVNPVSSLLL